MYKALLFNTISQAIPVDAHAVFLDHFLCQFVSVIIQTKSMQNDVL